MSMTQVAFFEKAKIPTKENIESTIKEFQPEFEIIEEFEQLLDLNGLECKIKGQKTFFEMYTTDPNEILEHEPWIKPDIKNENISISFVWGADFAAGACIGLISLALIELSDAQIYYLDDKMKYSKEMLLDDMELFIEELENQNITNIRISSEQQYKPTQDASSNSLWEKIKNLFK
jgi:hypothetical protein